MNVRGRSLASGAAGGLAARLLVAIALVMVSGIATAWAVAVVVGPALFHEHMIRAGLEDHDEAVLHAEEAFQAASVLSLSLALAAAVIASLVVSVFLTRRVAASLRSLSSAASRVGNGAYGSHVPSPRMGSEFDELVASFNRMADRLEEGERLRARLLADVAHEVRTPVATIAGYLEAIEDGVKVLDASTTEVLREQTARLTHLSRDLAAVTQAESGALVLDRERVDPGELAMATVQAAHGRAAEHGVTLRADVTAGVPAVLVDRLRMAQVLDNLVANAVRHTPTGGLVVVSARRAPGGAVELSVEDTGEGVAEEHLPHLFERFYRVDTARSRDRGGSGIGLAICKALTEAHGGRIRAASGGPGQGSTFTVLLPAA